MTMHYITHDIARHAMTLYHITHYIALHSMTLYYITHYIALHDMTLHYMTHYIALHAMTLHYSRYDIALHAMTRHTLCVVKVQHRGVREAVTQDLDNAVYLAEYLAEREPKYDMRIILGEWCRETRHEVRRGVVASRA